MSGPLPSDSSEERINDFIEATNSTRDDAVQYLEMAEWQLGAAIDLWFDGVDDAEEDEGPATEPAPPSNPAPAPTAGRGGPIRTLHDLNPSAGNDDDDDDASDNDYFAGGEKSGLAVQGNPPGERSNELLQGLFDRARRCAEATSLDFDAHIC
jgi:UBX domain-containing protein 1